MRDVPLTPEARAAVEALLSSDEHARGYERGYHAAIHDARVPGSRAYAALGGAEPTAEWVIRKPTDAGYDSLWVHAINGVLEDRDVTVRVADLSSRFWDRWIGPMIDAIEDGEPVEEWENDANDEAEAEADEWIKPTVVMLSGSDVVGVMPDDADVEVRQYHKDYMADSGDEYDVVYPAGCDCAGHGPIPGVLWPWNTNSDDTHDWIERCDQCAVYDDDLTAAYALATHLGTTFNTARVESLNRLAPYIDREGE